MTDGDNAKRLCRQCGGPDPYRTNRLCRACSGLARRRNRSKDPKRAIFSNKRCSARKAGIEFTLRFEDIAWPTHCPALGTELEYAAGRLGRDGRRVWRDARVIPSFDRIDPTKGYTPDNVQVVSLAANVIKGLYTAAEVGLVAEWLARSK